MSVMKIISYILHMLGCLTLGGATPLDDYVNRPDPVFDFYIISKIRGATHTLYTLNMTSQTWKPNLQSQPVWWHYLAITVPDTIDKDSGFMIIDGGSNHDGPPASTDSFVELSTIVAVSTNSVGACLKQVPNQPIVFKLFACPEHISENIKGKLMKLHTLIDGNDRECRVQSARTITISQADPAQQSRTEDAIIAWTWKTFVDENGTDPEILLRMPMTKAAVRAMDAIQDTVFKVANKRINRFVVSGASKRGWATWTTAAVDKRVVALAPMVMDLLNLVKNLHHFYRSLGGWTFEFEDYYALNFTSQLDNPATQLMADIVDPIVYKDRYKDKPIMIVCTGGDEFFMVDDTQFYYDQLPKETYIRMVPNAEHSLDGFKTNIIFAIRAFYLSVVTGTPLPKMTWKLEYTSRGGKITMQTDRTPQSIQVYYATTLDGIRKDFRLIRGTPGDPLKPQVHPVVWLSKSATPLGNNTFTTECDNPREGWTAFFIQATFQGVDGSMLEFTTQTLVTPDTYPFPECHGSSCLGVLV